MTELPVWLLDIDGVLNATAIWLKDADRLNRPVHAWPVEDWIDSRVWASKRSYRILVAKPVIDFINRIHESGVVEIRWHTTWQNLAGNVAVEFGLPDFPVQYAPEFIQRSTSDGWWKLPAVWRVLAEGRRVVWTDDDVNVELTDQQKLTLAAAGCLAISPHYMTGLCRDHLVKIEEFLHPQIIEALEQQ